MVSYLVYNHCVILDVGRVQIHTGLVNGTQESLMYATIFSVNFWNFNPLFCRCVLRADPHSNCIYICTKFVMFKWNHRNVMYLGSFLLSLIFWDPRDFFWPVLLSFISVVAACLLYSYYVYLVHNRDIAIPTSTI